MEPSNETIDQVCEFTSLDNVHDRDLVIQALKHNNGNSQEVIGQFFENPDSFRAKYQKLWDDSMFTADRDGNDNTAGISFHVESSDPNIVIQGVTPPPSSHAYGAPSRPPSRSNNRSPLGTMVDWTAAHVPGNSLFRPDEHALTGPFAGVPNSQAQEDDDMQRAIRESAQEAGITMPEHESGITGPSEPAAPQFGPANREIYEASSWAMVPTGPIQDNSNEVAASKRKRTPGAPAMLVINSPQRGNHRLGGLLTIMHEIPIARNVLLSIGSPAATYGHNSDWWRGQEILAPEVLQKMAKEQSWDHGAYTSSTAFEDEVHRLMAFLDSTERGYGSITVLADILDHPDSAGMEKRFYEMLGQRHPDSIRPIMQVAALAMFHGGDLEEDAKFGLLEIEHLRNEYSCIKTLYEALDHVMWSDTLGWDRIHEGSKMAFFKEMGEVLVLNTTGDGPDDPFEIPLEFYPEKYLESRKDEARRIQRGWCQTKEQMTRILTEKEQIYRLKGSWGNGTTDDKRTLLKKATDQWEEYRIYVENFARFRTLKNSRFDSEEYPDYHTAPPNVDDTTYEQSKTIIDVIDYSEKLLADLEARMEGLDTELEQIKAKQRALGRLLTVPDKPSRPRPMTCKKYLLRGVVTSPNIVYVCQREEADLIELNGEESKPADQWWRVAFTPHADQVIKAEKTSVEGMFDSMWKETMKPLLVYATEEALRTPIDPLSSQLERFIKVENKAFHQELSKEESVENEAKQTAFVDAISPISPSKRKHRADSSGSMDSNRASIGSGDSNGFEDPFADQDEKIGTEMMDYGTPSTYVLNFDAINNETPPTLPTRPQASTASTTEPTSATMSPSTVGAGHTDNIPSGTEEPRSPEMQEKARPPFMSLSRKPSEQKEPVNLMDMDIPDEKQ
ncbi:hypothetical protein F53441_6077 [Fusarium austroafricanum]|uniref:Ubiquitin interaction domain-containing protein n=1 Tax=Fusarium austroafricanum TaxID=2364996 RepID=A0A8H4NTR6_9HYPO|nr:hypothetical protein F53441_6077 [Fusarium austroafricanum]